MEPILLDTDICLDSLAGREPWNVDANQIFHASVEGLVDLFISGLTFSNLFYLLGRTHGSKKTVQKLSAMRDLVSVSTVDEEIVDLALKSGWADFEDALQYFSALDAGCELLITRNTSDYKKAKNITVKDSAAFVSKYLGDDD
ncbi:type II toxin-antitoxin system VapC family toxin [Fodinibius sp. SL11]|uniref:type II toxin-antitoxin system VapC family toxin n=1 Tax=Fodinibius sp. SL11 TaxID=3425690 RepID=UPI003F883668